MLEPYKFEFKNQTARRSYREYRHLHFPSAGENCMTKKISSFRNLKVAALLCAAKAAIPCGIAASKLEYRL